MTGYALTWYRTEFVMGKDMVKEGGVILIDIGLNYGTVC